MSPLKISVTIFLVFLIVQTGKFTTGMCHVPKNSLTASYFHPTKIVQNPSITPPRQVTICKSSSLTTVRPGGRGMSLTPVEAWVFGLKMNWSEVTSENLRWIPGMRRGTAERLIRIRDLYEIHTFTRLSDFPKIDRKTIQRLKKYCYIPHAN